MIYLDKTASLMPASRRILCDKSTEAPHSGPYNDVIRMGTYLCRRCGLALFRAHNQFHASCGWPSFDDDITGAVKQIPDADGRRQEILCSRCEGHLGHLFFGEHHTQKNARYCVNGASIDFVEDSTVLDTSEALLAGGCFWGIDYYLSLLPGVLNIEVGFSGGHTDTPTYNEVCGGGTGHYEVARVLFDIAKTDYSTVLKRFFEIHDPTQRMGQGPDIGEQYQSAVFYHTSQEKSQAEALIEALISNGYDIVTHLLPAKSFWPAEEAHQHYYARQGTLPACHRVITRFVSNN